MKVYSRMVTITKVLPLGTVEVLDTITNKAFRVSGLMWDEPKA